MATRLPTEPRPLAIGTLVLLTVGTHDDYMVDGLFRVVKAFDPVALSHEVKLPYEGGQPAMATYLTDNGFVEPVPMVELNLDCGGKLPTDYYTVMIAREYAVKPSLD